MTPGTLAAWIFFTSIAAFACWLYYSTVLPSIRSWARLDLFRLRDELRQLVIDGRLPESDKAFGVLDADLSSMIATISHVDVVTILMLGHTVASEEIDSAVDKRYKIVFDHEMEDIKSIDRRAMRIIFVALVFNSLVWLPLLFVAALALLLGALVKTGIDGLKARFYRDMTRAALAGEDSSFQHLRAA